MKTYRALVIGAGNIGAFFDSPQSQSVLTHAHAYCKNHLCELVGFVDSDYARAVRAAKIWGGGAFRTVQEAFRSGPIDIVSVSASTASHSRIMAELADTSVRGILLEKPIASTMKEADAILSLFARKKPIVTVNYTRRFLDEFQRMKASIQSGIYGSFVTAHCYFSGGILNNGSHFIDLLNFLLGKRSEVCAVIGQKRKEKDPKCSVVLKVHKNQYVYLMSAHQQTYSIFDMEFLFERRKIIVRDSDCTIDEFAVQPDPLWKGYSRLKKVRSQKIDYGQAMENTVRSFLDAISKNRPVQSSLREAYEAQSVCARVLEKTIEY